MQNQKRNMPSLAGSYCNTTNTTCAARAVRGHLMQQFRFFSQPVAFKRSVFVGLRFAVQILKLFLRLLL